MTDFNMKNSEIDRETDNEIDKAVEVLRNGGIILYPTDTVWGIGCDATNHQAVSRIYGLKKREDSKSMLTLVDSEKMLAQWINEIPEAATEYIRNSERPVTIIYDNPSGIARNLLAADGSLGIRLTREKFSSELCRRLCRPIVSTSANVSGQPTPSFFNEIEEYIMQNVDYIPQYRRDDTTSHSPSMIIKISSDNKITVIRE